MVGYTNNRSEKQVNFEHTGRMEKISEETIASTYQQLKVSKTPHSRGRALEMLIGAVLSNERLDPHTSYRPAGEEIDGSFFWQGQTFLLEAKWHANPVPVSMVYTFKGKLDGKFHTTSGIFISMSGYSKEAKDALTLGKTLNIIFFDGGDLELILLGKVKFLDMLKYKLREAGDTGSIYTPYSVRKQAKTIKNETPTLPAKREKRSGKKAAKDLLVFVEGKNDFSLVQTIMTRLADQHLIYYGVVPLNGVNGVRDLPALLNEYGADKKLKGAIILLDEDARSFEPIVLNVIEQIEKSANPVKIQLQYLSPDRKKAISKETPSDDLEENDLFIAFDIFIEDLIWKERDPFYYIPAEAIEGTLTMIIWDKQSGVARFESNDEHERDEVMHNIDELVQFIEDQVYRALESELPSIMLVDLDHSWQIREFINEHYLHKIESIGWNPNDV